MHPVITSESVSVAVRDEPPADGARSVEDSVTMRHVTLGSATPGHLEFQHFSDALFDCL